MVVAPHNVVWPGTFDTQGLCYGTEGQSPLNLRHVEEVQPKGFGSWQDRMAMAVYQTHHQEDVLGVEGPDKRSSSTNGISAKRKKNIRTQVWFEEAWDLVVRSNSIDK